MEPSGPGEFKCTEKTQLSAAMTHFFIIASKKEKFVEKILYGTYLKKKDKREMFCMFCISLVQNLGYEFICVS